MPFVQEVVLCQALWLRFRTCLRSHTEIPDAKTWGSTESTQPIRRHHLIFRTPACQAINVSTSCPYPYWSLPPFYTIQTGDKHKGCEKIADTLANATYSSHNVNYHSRYSPLPYGHQPQLWDQQRTYNSISNSSTSKTRYTCSKNDK